VTIGYKLIDRSPPQIGGDEGIFIGLPTLRVKSLRVRHAPDAVQSGWGWITVGPRTG
jgi:hypothetical protein